MSPPKSHAEKGKNKVVENDSDSDFELHPPTKRKLQSPLKLKLVVPDSESESEFYRSTKRRQIIAETSTKGVGNRRTSAIQGFVAPKNCFGTLTVDYRQINYRSNLRSTITELKKLVFSDQDIDEIKKTPFGVLFEALLSISADAAKTKFSKCEEDISKILMSFDQPLTSFMVAGMKLVVSKLDLELIFGVFGGTDDIKIKSIDYAQCQWVQRCLKDELNGNKNKGVQRCLKDELNGNKNKDVLYTKVFIDKLNWSLTRSDANRSMDVARLVICYLLCALLTPNQNGSMNWALTYYMEDIDQIKKFRWSSYILQMLNEQMKNSKTLRVGGCAILIPFWFCEHTCLIRPEDGVFFPRFLKWDLNKLHEELKKLKKDAIPKLSSKIVKRVQLKYTPSERGVLLDVEKSEPTDCIPHVAKLDGQLSNHDCSVEVPNQKQPETTKLQSPYEASRSLAICGDLFDGPLFSLGLGLTQMTSPSVEEKEQETPPKIQLMGDEDNMAELLMQKDEEINKLRAVVADLKYQLGECAEPTFTQIFLKKENTDAVDHIVEIKILQDKNVELVDENNKLRAENKNLLRELNRHASPVFNGDTTGIQEEVITINQGDAGPSEPTRTTSNIYQSEQQPTAIGSMFRRVKARTENDERMPKELSLVRNPQNRVQPVNRRGPIVLEKKILDVQKTTKDIKVTIERWDECEDGRYCFKGKRPISHVTIDNVLEILHHKSIADSVIDAWSEIMVLKYGHLNSSNLPVIFSSSCLGFIESYRNGQNRNLKALVDSKIKSEIQNDVFVFPLLSLADYWTLLKLDLTKGEWSFLNSMILRRKNAADKNKKKVMVLVDYVEKVIVKCLELHRQDHPFIQSASRRVINVDCIQQTAGSVDCGVIVCKHIETMVKGWKVKTGEFCENESANYRKKMASFIIDPVENGVFR